MKPLRLIAFALAVACAAYVATPARADENWFPFPVEVWEPPFDMASPRRNTDYVPLEKAGRKWRICVSIPHLKDAYWLAVNFALADEARRLGVAMEIFEAGGYDHQEKQIAQLEQCLAAKHDGFIISAISATALNPLVDKLRDKGLPVVDLVNGMTSKRLSAKSLVNFGDMGALTGKYIVDQNKGGGATRKVAWFPGPKGAAWVAAGDSGFRKALEGSKVEIVTTGYGDTGKEAQAKLIEAALDKTPDVDYIAGTSVTAEAAVRVLRKRRLDGKVKIMAYYFGPGVYRGIKRGKIIGAPSDMPAIQARIAVDQLVRILEHKPYLKHVGPKISVIDAEKLKGFDLSTTLAPQGFRPIFRVN